jgi:digeranylgeranylglycerophospholipid reductase
MFDFEEIEVAIVGAGPGGTSTAKYLAEKGVSVVVFEKRQEIGAPKRCAEGISASTVETLKQKIPKRCIAQKIDGAIVYAPNGKSTVIDYGKTCGYILERKLYDKWLAEEAVRKGARIFAKANVYDVIKENGWVKGIKVDLSGKRFKVKSKVVVAADGIESTIARKAGLNTTNALINVDSGYQFEMCGIDLEDPHKIVFYFGNEIAPRGYLWVFPKGKDKANVGIGICGKFARKTAREYLENFVHKNENLRKGSIIEVNAGGIPVGGLLRNMVLNGFLVVGDAAHQVNPIHGGGLKEAQLAGKIAANVIAKAISQNDVSEEALSKYNEIWWRERGKKLEKIQRLREVVERLSDDDLNWLAENLTGKDLIAFSQGKGFGKLVKLLAKKPKLVTLARHLVM